MNDLGSSECFQQPNSVNADSDRRREIIDSIFPDKLRFDNGVVRINRGNEVVKCVYQITNDLGGLKKIQNGDKTILSREVEVAGCLIQLLKS